MRLPSRARVADRGIASRGRGAAPARRGSPGRGGLPRRLAGGILALAFLGAVALPGGAADQPPQALSKEQLEQLVAPIALYPDALLAQVLMASTYPLEVVAAARWVKANPKVTGDALEDAMQQQTWDPSVKSLTAFPQVLEMMNEKLDWTTQLGDAFLAQQSDVMNAVQRLRVRAKDAGNLESNEQQQVIVEQQPAGGQPQTIVIQPANPQVVYVPTYNPTVVYGAWPYPAYPPYYYYPPGYTAAASILSFGVGMAVGSALWGDCNWGGGDVDINVNRYNEFNRTDIKNNRWEHNSEHRKGVQYRDQATRERYGKTDATGAQARESFRGRAEQGQREMAGGGGERIRQDLARGGGAERAGAARVGEAGAGRGAAGDRRGGASAGQLGAGQARSGGERSASAFRGMGDGAQVRQQSQRGAASRPSARSYGGGGGRSGGGGGARGGGGGGARGGGGGGARGGGGRGGGRR